jgi:glycosyltransferase involved in cell wall biosynthesis
MKFLLVHNYYQNPGGEDQVFSDECALLEAHGHDVIRYTVHNDSMNGMGSFEMARRTLWNPRSYAELRALVRRERPVLMHCANTFPLVSPAAYYAAHAEGAAVVQTLHNYRLLCPNALFLRDGRVCEDCLGKFVPWPAIQHGCYRGSRSASTAVAGLLAAHRAIGTWRHQVDRFIALSDFARRKFIAGGFPAERLVVKSNFVSTDTGPGPGRGGYAVCIGRLSEEKGIQTLLAAWARMKSLVPLKIIGDGPLAEQVRAAAAQDSAIEWLGQRPFDEVQTIIGDAACLIAPSVCYEGALPRTIIEAFCQGTPVVASSLGAMAELVEPGHTGWLFEPGNSTALAEAVTDLLSRPDRLAVMRARARAEFESRYTARDNYQRLMTIYADALRARNNHAAAEACAIQQPLPRTDAAATTSCLHAVPER